jgi:methionyl-tRNA formyltransferase
MIGDGMRVKVWRAVAASGEGPPGVVRPPGELVTVDGVLRLDEVQPEGRPHMTGEAWMAGLHAGTLAVEPVEAP